METEPLPACGILLIEDDRDVRETIAEVLEEEGYLVSVARTGLDALAQLANGQGLPAVIVLDLMMPVMDGWEFRSAQQGNPAWAPIPIVVMSADSNVKEKATSIRAAACLRKPLQIDELLAILKRLTGERARCLQSEGERS